MYKDVVSTSSNRMACSTSWRRRSKLEGLNLGRQCHFQHPHCNRASSISTKMFWKEKQLPWSVSTGSRCLHWPCENTYIYIYLSSSVMCNCLIENWNSGAMESMLSMLNSLHVQIWIVWPVDYHWRTWKGKCNLLHCCSKRVFWNAAQHLHILELI